MIVLYDIKRLQGGLVLHNSVNHNKYVEGGGRWEVAWTLIPKLGVDWLLMVAN